jgi:3-oxoadipate enol-lactonase
MKLCPLEDGGRLAYRESGSGEPILLLRPLGGSLASWGRFAETLSRTLHVVAFEPRGAAGSSSRAPLGTSTRSMARDARALLDHLRLPRAHVYGISLGGMVASWLALDSPERVERLILASTLPSGWDVSRDALGRGLQVARCMLKPAREAEACLAERILSHRFRARHPEQVARIRAEALAQPARRTGLLQLMAAAMRHDVRPRLREIAAPTLLLAGELDPILTRSTQEELLRGIPDARLELIPDSGHDISVEAPELTAERVLAHVQTWKSRCNTGARRAATADHASRVRGPSHAFHSPLEGQWEPRTNGTSRTKRAKTREDSTSATAKRRLAQHSIRRRRSPAREAPRTSEKTRAAGASSAHGSG